LDKSIELSIPLLDARECEIPEQKVNQGMKPGTNERNFLGCQAILLQSKSKYVKYAEYKK
jgi:hypothetical protein